MSTSAVLREAGDILRYRGWTQGEYEVSPGGPVCAWGAVRVAIGWNWGDDETGPLTDVLGTNLEGVVAWNDDPLRNVDDVLFAMDAAYVLALQQEGIEPGDVL